MMLNYYNFISLLPIIILGLIIVILLLSIIVKRNYLFCTTISIVGLVILLFLTIFFKQIKSTDIIGILFLVDNHSKLYTVLIIIVGLISCIFSSLWLKDFVQNKEEFYILIIIAILGCIVLINSNHMGSLIIGIELMSLSICGMICYDLVNNKHSLESAIKYSVLSSIASAFLLFGISLIYFELGQLNFINIIKKIFYEKNITNNLLWSGIGMIIIGLSIKLSIAPFHLWSPDVDQGSKFSVIIINTTSKIVIFFTLLKIFIFLLPILHKKNIAINIILNIFALSSIFIGNLMAITSNNLKRILSYSSIAHFGYLIIALVVLLKIKNSNFYSVINSFNIYLFSYLINSLCVFGILNSINYDKKFFIKVKENNSIELYRGLFWKKPTLSILLTISILSMSGIPITIGFISKFFLFSLAIEENLFYLIISMFIGTIISYYYYLRLIVNIYLRPKKYNLIHAYLNDKFFKKPFLKNININFCNLILLILILNILVLGVYPQPLISFLNTSINYL